MTIPRASKLLVLQTLHQREEAGARPHSEHRFPAPSSKEGCRKPVLGVWSGARQNMFDISPVPSPSCSVFCAVSRAAWQSELSSGTQTAPPESSPLPCPLPRLSPSHRSQRPFPRVAVSTPLPPPPPIRKAGMYGRSMTKTTTTKIPFCFLFKSEPTWLHPEEIQWKKKKKWKKGGEDFCSNADRTKWCIQLKIFANCIHFSGHLASLIPLYIYSHLHAPKTPLYHLHSNNKHAQNDHRFERTPLFPRYIQFP